LISFEVQNGKTYENEQQNTVQKAKVIFIFAKMTPSIENCELNFNWDAPHF
jgi:hypothetical protein